MTPKEKAELQDRIKHEGYEYALFEWGGWNNPKCDNYIDDRKFQGLHARVLLAKTELRSYLESVGIEIFD